VAQLRAPDTPSIMDTALLDAGASLDADGNLDTVAAVEALLDGEDQDPRCRPQVRRSSRLASNPGAAERMRRFLVGITDGVQVEVSKLRSNARSFFNCRL
jgi:hypothetical protein